MYEHLNGYVPVCPECTHCWQMFFENLDNYECAICGKVSATFAFIKPTNKLGTN